MGQNIYSLLFGKSHCFKHRCLLGGNKTRKEESAVCDKVCLLLCFFLFQCWLFLGHLFPSEETSEEDNYQRLYRRMCLLDSPCGTEREACTDCVNRKLRGRGQPDQPHLLADLHAHSGLGDSSLFSLGLRAGRAQEEA